MVIRAARGHRRAPPPPQRDCEVHFRVTAAELENLHWMARQKRMTLDEFARWCIAEHAGRLA